ncbi:MAG: helix-turn-helix domain-containing protein [Planctomycetota bacterium]
MDRNDSLNMKPAEIRAAFEDPHWAAEFPPVLSVDQAALLIQVPKATIYEWSSRKLLRGCARKVGKHLRIFRDRFLAQIANEGIQRNGK